MGGGTPDLVLHVSPTPAYVNTIVEDKTTVNVAKLDLDVTGDLDFDDPEDKAINYLPGYRGDTRVLSTGTTFNTAQYVGQKMQVVLNGVGYVPPAPPAPPVTNGTVITGVDFQLENPSEQDGFCVNGFDVKVGWDGKTVDANGTPQIDGDKNDDFSFKEDKDARVPRPLTTDPDPVVTQAGKTTVPLWCKDYGGRTVVKAVVKAGTVEVGTFKLTVPLDEDKDQNGNLLAPDGIADRWEKEKVKEWNTQFGKTETVNTAFFNDGHDKELQDPDDARTDANRLTFSNSVPNATPSFIPDAKNMGNHAQDGDRRNVLAEYRGFILDGGGFDSSGQQQFNAFGIVPSGTVGAATFAGGHVRLSPAHKEFLVAVDAMIGPNGTAILHMPNQAGIVDWMDAQSRGISQRQDGAGCRLFYVLHNLATLYYDFPGANDANDDATNDEIIRSYLEDRIDPTVTPSYRPLTSFKHLQLSRRFGQMASAGAGFDTFGAIFAVDRMSEIADFYDIPKNTYAKGYIAHELHHTIITNAVTEHFSDANGNGTNGEADDKIRVLWNYNFDYRSQATTLAQPIVGGATGAIPIELVSTTNLTTQGWIRIGRGTVGNTLGTLVRYTGVSGNQLIGCQKVTFVNGKATYSSLGAFDAGTLVEPEASGESNRQIQYGAGTTQQIYRFTPNG